AWPSPADINAVIDYATQHYRVNNKRIYLTGTSMNGGATWEFAGNNANYARKLAAIIPVCGASWPERGRANVIATANLPVWATHNDEDPTVPIHYSRDYVNYINGFRPAPSPPAKLTVFDSPGH